MSKTFQLSNVNQFGVMRKIVPMTTDQVLNQESCFEVNGTAEGKIGAQSILPDATGFTVCFFLLSLRPRPLSFFFE